MLQYSLYSVHITYVNLRRQPFHFFSFFGFTVIIIMVSAIIRIDI